MEGRADKTWANDAVEDLAVGTKNTQQTWMDSHEPMLQRAVDVGEKDDNMIRTDRSGHFPVNHSQLGGDDQN